MREPRRRIARRVEVLRKKNLTLDQIGRIDRTVAHKCMTSIGCARCSGCNLAIEMDALNFLEEEMQQEA